MKDGNVPFILTTNDDADDRMLMKVALEENSLHHVLDFVEGDAEFEREEIFRPSLIITYDLGVNSFMCKPVRFDELVGLAREIGNYWFGTVALPRN